MIMIKGINTSGRYVTVTGGTASDPYISPGSVGAGMLRWNSNMNNMEVNDGNSWKTLSMNYATVELTPEAESLMEWARKERDKQRTREDAVRRNPALRKAYEAIQRAEENFDLLETIAREHSSDQTESMPVSTSP
jgi:hypothetical protein